MIRSSRLAKASIALVLACGGGAIAPLASAAAELGPAAAEKLYERVTPSLVAVKYTWESELGRRELVGAGIVVSEDGLIMTTIGTVPTVLPDAQLKDFKILIPSQERDPEEIDATFEGRDERTNTAFLRVKPEKGDDEKAGKDDKSDKDEKKDKSDKDKSDTEKSSPDKSDTDKSDKDKSEKDKSDQSEKREKSEKSQKAEKSAKSDKEKPAKHVWKPLKFEDVNVQVGEPVYSVGMLPEGAAYKSYLMESKVSVTLRGDIPQVLVQGGGLAGVGSPVFNAAGKAIGLVSIQQGQNIFLNDESGALPAITNPPKFYVPARDFTLSLQDPPIAGKPVPLPWMGVPEMTGLNKDVAEVFDLTNKPAVQIGKVLPDTPAAAAGLKEGDIIVKLNGEPLERGDEASELPGILRRKLLRMKPGTQITLSVIRKRGKPPEDVKVTLGDQPKQQNLAKRFWAENLGFAVRDMVFIDRYARRLPADAPGVVVALIRPQGPAQSAGLQGNGISSRSDVIQQLNGQPVKDVEDFEKLYKQARKEKPKEAVVLVVRREGREDTVRIEPPQ